MSKPGSGFCKFEPLSSTQKMIPLCGSNSLTFAASQSAWHWRRRQSIHCSRQKGYVHDNGIYYTNFIIPCRQLQYLRDEQHMKAPPNVVYAQLKYMWSTGAREESLNFLRQFSTSLARDLQMESKDHSQRSGVGKHKLEELSRLLARCYFKQGHWQVELKDDWGSVSVLVSVTPLTHQLVSGTSRIYYIHTSWQLTTIQTGTRPGTRGHWLTLRSLAI
jgi:hypothetical protein